MADCLSFCNVQSRGPILQGLRKLAPKRRARRFRPCSMASNSPAVRNTRLELLLDRRDAFLHVWREAFCTALRGKQRAPKAATEPVSSKREGILHLRGECICPRRPYGTCLFTAAEPGGTACQ